MPTPRAMSVPKPPVPISERCSVMATLALIGDFWTLGVLRCATYGMRRFSDFQSELGIATNVLTDRLARLVEAGILNRVPYQEHPPRHEYSLTEDGLELVPIVVALKTWGDRHLQELGPWSALRHRGCTSPVEVAVVCPDCGKVPSKEDVDVVVLRPT